MSTFTQGNWFWKWFLNDYRQYWFGYQVGYQPQRISFSHQNCLPTIGFQKLRQPPLCLFWVVNRSLPFIFLRSEAGWLRFSIQIWPHERKNYLKNSICKSNYSLHLRLCSEMEENYFGVSSTVCDELMHSGKSHVLKYDNRLRSPEDGFQIWNDKIIIGWKAIHHHQADQNPHQRWSLPQR